MVYETYIFDLLTLHAHGEKVVASSVHSGPTSCLESRRGKKRGEEGRGAERLSETEGRKSDFLDRQPDSHIKTQ